MVFWQITGLPAQVWQPACKVNGMLSGAAANFEYAVRIRKNFLDDTQYGVPVLIAGL